MKKLGIFGGSFDPIHYGHLRPALEILQALSLDEIRFIPSGHPPHRGAPVAPARLRLAMVEAAVKEEPRFKVDTRELIRPSPSYTVDTLEALRREFPHDALVVLVGLDAFLGLGSWHRWQEIFGLAHLVVAHRPGSVPPAEGPMGDVLQRRLVRSVSEALKEPTGRILMQPVTQFDISSTRIRECAARGEDVRYLVPDAVRQLILESNCYRKES